MALFLGLDIGSSSIKASILDVVTGEIIAAASSPDEELPISSPAPGFAEQDPELWWSHAVICCHKLKQLNASALSSIEGIGIAYQMHGLVTLDKDNRPLRPAIIWCDSRAVEIGERAREQLGNEYVSRVIRNSPGNFTASKLRWVIEHQPEIAGQIKKICLPGDYIGLRLTGELLTTASGLSEGVLWDFERNSVAQKVIETFEIDASLLPDVAPTFALQGRVSAQAAQESGLPDGVPVCYRAGDQPNNALSLGVLNPGEIAATGGTSGVIYAVSDSGASDQRSRVNVFLHVNHQPTSPRYGTLLCINGCGILNSWIRKICQFSDQGQRLSYKTMDAEAAAIAPGSDGLSIYPYGNGAERTLGNLVPGASLSSIDLNRHSRAHLYRAAQEGIVFALAYGVEALKSIGVPLTRVNAGRANMFLSPVFQEIFAQVIGVPLSLYDTDGASGAARGAAIGSGLFKEPSDAFRGLRRLSETHPDILLSSRYQEIYNRWKSDLERTLAHTH